LKKHDIYVVTYDHNGHGNRDNGNRGEIESFEKLVLAAKDVYDSLPDELPKFVSGHSMGSIVLRLLLTSIRPTGAVTVGTGDRTTSVEKIKTAFVNGVSKITPNFKGLLLIKFAFCGFDRYLVGLVNIK